MASLEPLIPPAKRRKERVKSEGENDVIPMGIDSQVEYRRGSIIRLTMRNFVTYTHAEIRPGPQLNVVIGPNGTGKSTLVCAMVLGLGGKPAVLGRAKEPRDFIKRGQDSGTVEVELYGGRGARNVVIRRKIFSDNQSAWKINGSAATIKDVLAITKKFSVQVDNLCQFLPQDRVSSFAAMDPVELLHETELAINEELEAQHQALIDMKRDEIQLRVSYDAQTKTLKELKDLNENLRRDVLRFQERQRLVGQLALVESKRPWVAFEMARTHALAMQEQVTTAQSELDAAETRIQPLVDAYERAKQLSESGENEESTAVKKMRNLTTRRAQLLETLKSLAEKTKTEEFRLTKAESDAEKRSKLVARAKARIEELEAKIEQAASAEQDRLNRLEKLRARNEELRAAEKAHEASWTDARKRVVDAEQEHSTVVKSIKTIESSLRMLIETIKKSAPHSWRLREHIHSDGRAHLKGAVFGPIVMEMKTYDELHALWLEKALSYQDLTGFVCESADDRDYLEAWCREQKIVIPRLFYSPNALSDFVRPLKKKQLEAFGLDGYLDTLFDAPPLVKWNLCNVSKLHTIPYGTDASKSEKEENMEEIRKLVRSADAASSIRRFFTPQNQFMFKPSFYGSGVIITANPLPTGRNNSILRRTSPGVDMQRLRDQEAFFNTEIQRLNMDVRRIQDEMNKIKSERSALKTEMDKVQHSDIRSLQQQLRSAQTELEELDLDPASERDKLRDQIKASLIQRIKPARELSEVTSEWVTAQIEVARLVLHRGTLRQLAEQAAEVLRAAKGEYASVRDRLELAKQKFVESREKAKVLREEAKNKVIPNEELKQQWIELPNTLQELDEMIDQLKIRINSMVHDPATMEKYEQRAAEIDKLTDALRNHEQTLQEQRTRIEELKQVWKPKIQQYVEQIDANFAKYFSEIGCVGNVQLAADDDNFEKYGIDIWVSYRANEAANRLDARVQSGGERSVATMLYLIALQQLSDSPFRLVDEINQGMDPYNERMIFDQVTRQASKPKTPQYFLITPKLLPDLKFTPAITVLCVFNGPYMVDQAKWTVK